MVSTSPSSPSRRRRLLAALVVAVSGIAAPASTGAPPAGALTPAPLVTADGLGIRVNETAIDPVLPDLVTASHEATHALLYAAVVVDPIVANPVTLEIELDYRSTVDFLAPGPSRPNGAVALHAELDGLAIRFGRVSWWHPLCEVELVSGGGTVDLLSKVSMGLLPDVPFTDEPPVVDLDGAPVVSSTGACGVYAPSSGDAATWWEEVVGTSVLGGAAAGVAAALDAAFADLLAQIWSDNVVPVIDSLGTLTGAGVGIDVLYTDSHGFVTIADVDATGGMTVGSAGPYPVGAAVDAGVTTDIHALLAQQQLDGIPSDVIVSLHPNVANQYLAALTLATSGSFSTMGIDDDIEAALVDPSLGACYTNPWSMRLRAQAPPFLAPTGFQSTPELQMPAVTLQFFNTGCNPNPFLPVATFTGSMDGIAAPAEGSPLQPRIDADTAQWDASLTQADTATAARVPLATDTDILPWAHEALDAFAAVVPDFVDLAPGGFPDHGAVHCVDCGQYVVAADQRITDTFHIS